MVDEGGRGQGSDRKSAVSSRAGSELPAALEFARAASARHEHAADSTYRVVVVSHGAFSLHDLVDSASTYAVVGRSELAHVALSGDSDVALRHALVRPVRTSAGWALRIVDLGSDSGLILGARARARDVYTEGDVAVAIGSHALVALRRATAVPPFAAPRISTAGPVMLGSPEGALVDAAAHITLSRGDVHATLSLSAEALSRGVILGRSSMSASASLASVLSPTLSREHALLILEGGTLMLFDLASSTGTFVGKARVGAHALVASAPVRLGLDDPVWLRLDDEALASAPDTARGLP